MSAAAATAVTLVVLAAAGLPITLAVVGARVVTVPLMPLSGAVVAAMAATGYLAAGGSFMIWFVGLALTTWVGVAAYWWARPEARPAIPRDEGRGSPGVRYRATGIAGAVAVVGACAWCLRGLSTPTVGFDARGIWLLRSGWFLQPHHQLLGEMRLPDLLIPQSAYPPLVSAVTSVAWSVTGNQSARVGVTVVALLNTCALAVAAFALVEAARRSSFRLRRPASNGPEAQAGPEGGSATPPGTEAGALPLGPLVVGVVVAVLLVFLSFGITEPFMTNGYADPIWSLAALGAVAYGLQLGASRSNRGVAGLLVLVTGLSKDEGLATAAILVFLIALRGVLALRGADRLRLWWKPCLVGVVELTVIGSWPALMRTLHARGESTLSSSPRDVSARLHAVVQGMAPYLHVLELALPMAVLGGLVLWRVRRAGGTANDLWAWAAVAGGLIVLDGSYTTEPGSINDWVGLVHRASEFPALTGWWIVAMWAVVGSGVPAAGRGDGSGRRVAVPASAPDADPRDRAPGGDCRDRGSGAHGADQGADAGLREPTSDRRVTAETP